MNEIDELEIKFTAGGLSVNISAAEGDVVYGSVTDFAAKILGIKALFGAAENVPSEPIPAPHVQRAMTLSEELLNDRHGVQPEEVSADDNEEELVERIPPPVVKVTQNDEDHGPLAPKDQALRAFLDEDPG